jgi:hypothetical protein
MKNVFKTLSLSILISFFAFNAWSQESEDQQTKTQVEEEKPDTRTDQEKFDEAEVRKFIELVTKELSEKKDVSKLSDKLLISDFSERMQKRSRFMRDFTNEIADELPIEEQISGNLEFLNAIYLVMASMNGNGIFQDEDKFNEMKTIDIANKVIPKSVFAIIEKNRFLNGMVKSEMNKEKNSTSSSKDDSEDSPKADEEEPKIENINELRELISAVKDINAEMRKYIDSQSDAWKQNNDKPSKIESERAKYFDSDACEGEDCKGLQQGQIIYHVDSFPFCVRIVNEFGSYKILDINIEFGD